MTHFFPLEPLLRAAGKSITISERPEPSAFGLSGTAVYYGERDEIATLADLLGVSSPLLRRRLRSGVDEWEADRWCLAIGVHPLEVFGQAWIDTGLEYGETLEAIA